MANNALRKGRGGQLGPDRVEYLRLKLEVKADQQPIAGQSVQLTATETNLADKTSRDATDDVFWKSDPPAVLTIASGGLASAPLTSAGKKVKVWAMTEGGIKSSPTELTISAAVPSIVVSSSRSFVGAGQTLQFTATPSAGLTAKPAWSSSSPNIATIDAKTGLATGVACGQTNITATYTDKTGIVGQASVPLNVVPNFTDLAAADTQAFMNAKSRVNQLLTAFERRGNLADAEIAQLKEGLELVTEYINNNPGTSIPNYNAASKAGNNVSDLQLLGINWNATASAGLGSSIGTGSGKANVIDDRFRAIADYLYGPPPVSVNRVSLEHDPGAFPFGNGSNPGSLTDDQMRIAAVYGYVQNAAASAPPYRTDDSLVTPEDKSRRNLFNQTVEAADADFRTSGPLYAAALARLIQISQPPQIKVTDWAKVVGVLVSQGITASNPQLNTWIDRALATAQNVGQDAPPSDIGINLPDLEQEVSNFEIISGNIMALQPAYFCSMLEELTKGQYKLTQTPIISAMSTATEASESALQTKAQLSGIVDINFKSDYLPLEKMADSFQIGMIQNAAKPGRGASAAAGGTAPAGGAPAAGATPPPGATTPAAPIGGAGAAATQPRA